LQKKLKN
jgi:serine/threonine protein kinase